VIASTFSTSAASSSVPCAWAEAVSLWKTPLAYAKQRKALRVLYASAPDLSTSASATSSCQRCGRPALADIDQRRHVGKLLAHQTEVGDDFAEGLALLA